MIKVCSITVNPTNSKGEEPVNKGQFKSNDSVVPLLVFDNKLKLNAKT